jgi:hypothetical protein
MPDGTFVERDVDPANHQFSILGEAMQVVADPGAHGHEFVLSRDFRL